MSSEDEESKVELKVEMNAKDEGITDNYTPADGRYSTQWPEDWSKEKIAEEARMCVQRYIEDWGWELHKYSRLNEPEHVRKVLRYEIHLETFDGFGKQKEVLDWRDEDSGQCAVWWLAMHGACDIVQLLIDCGCEVNLADNHGWTPLAVAAFHGHAKVVSALLSAGADPSKQVGDGGNAYDKAVASEHYDCAALLKDANGFSPTLSPTSQHTVSPPRASARLSIVSSLPFLAQKECYGVER